MYYCLDRSLFVQLYCKLCLTNVLKGVELINNGARPGKDSLPHNETVCSVIVENSGVFEEAPGYKVPSI